VSGGRGWLAAGAALALAALGLPWNGHLTGAAHPARVGIVAALVLAAVGLCTGRDRLLTAALGAGIAGVLPGGLDAAPGRLALAGALACLVLGCRRSGHALLPRRGVRPAAG
jgi:hypothetical protein